VSEGKGVSIIVKRIVEEEEERGVLKTISLSEKLYLEVAFFYLKQERSNPAIKTFVDFFGKEGKGLVRITG